MPNPHELEYAKDPSTSPPKRTFARNYRHSLTRTDALIRTRKLTAEEVTQINFIIKKRARRFIGAGRKEWLYPEKTVTLSWSDLRTTLLPPEDGMFDFGGEMLVKYASADVHYQDEFGRTEKPREFLSKRHRTSPCARKTCADAGGESRSRTAASRSPRRCARPGPRRASASAT